MKLDIEDIKKLKDMGLGQGGSLENALVVKNNSLMNENDRTIVGLLWHENISDIIQNDNISKTLSFYNKILENISFSDYIDRLIFQKQIWQLNELSCYIKIYYFATIIIHLI